MRADKAAYSPCPSGKAAEGSAAERRRRGKRALRAFHLSKSYVFIQRAAIIYRTVKPVLRPSAEGRAALPSFGLPLGRMERVEHYSLPI